MARMGGRGWMMDDDLRTHLAKLFPCTCVGFNLQLEGCTCEGGRLQVEWTEDQVRRALSRTQSRKEPAKRAERMVRLMCPESELVKRVARALFTLHVDSRCQNDGGELIHDLLINSQRAMCPYCPEGDARP